MIALFIIIAVLILVFLILRMNVHIIFDYHERPTITLKILFFRFDAIDLFRKYLNKDSGDNKKDKKAKKEGSLTNKSKKKSVDLLGFADFLVHVSRVISLAIKDHFSKSTVNLKELKVSVGSEDAAKTALLCGTVIQAANGLCAVLMHCSTFRCDNRNLSISPDFSSEKTTVALHLQITNKFIDIIKLFITTYFRFFEGKENNYARNSVKTGH